MNVWLRYVIFSMIWSSYACEYLVNLVMYGRPPTLYGNVQRLTVGSTTFPLTVSLTLLTLALHFVTLFDGENIIYLFVLALFGFGTFMLFLFELAIESMNTLSTVFSNQYLLQRPRRLTRPN